MKLRKPVFVLAALLAAAGGVFAQSYRTFQTDLEEARDRARLRLGFIRILPVFRLSDVGYDDNVYYRDRGDAAVSDYSGRIAADIKAFWVLGNSLILRFEESPEYLFFLKEKNLRRFTHSYAPGFRLLLLKRFALAGEFHDRKSVRRFSSEFDRPIEDTQKGFAASLFFETPRGTALGFSGTVDDYTFRDPSELETPSAAYRTLDRRERSGALEVYYKVFSDSMLFYRIEYAEHEFVSPEASWRDARSFRTAGGIRFPFLGRARGTLSLGYKKFTPEDESRKPFSGLVASSDVNFRIGRFGLRLGYLRDNFFSYLETAYYYIEDSFRGGLSFYVFPFLKIDGNIQHGVMKYPEPHLVWFQGRFYEVAARRDSHGVKSVGLTVRVSGDMGIGMNYNFYRRTSNAPGYNIDRGFLGAFVTYDF